MKLLIVGFLIFGSYKMFALDEMSSTVVKDSRGERIVALSNPTHPSEYLAFSALSSENGLCRSLGHLRAELGSARTGHSEESTLRIGDNGQIMEYTYDRPVTMIRCVSSSSSTPSYGTTPYTPPYTPPSYNTPPYIPPYTPPVVVAPPTVGGYVPGQSYPPGYSFPPEYNVPPGYSYPPGYGTQPGYGTYPTYPTYPGQPGYGTPTYPSQPGYGSVVQFSVNGSTGSVLVHPTLGLPFSATYEYSNSPSSEEGVCRALGFERAASGSSRSDREVKDTVRVDSQGKIIGGPSAYRMSQITCINPTGMQTQSFDALLTLSSRSLLFPGSNMPFSASSEFSNSPSSEDGVCRSLGFERAAAGSSRTDKVATNTVRVDSTGKIIGGPEAYRMTQIICLNRTQPVYGNPYGY